ncbi:PepSY domain-containing protein [Steroidobacter sp. S1-65]|uniref:PepSY domain-containing protein n=1 Tax=Steroidobacter gossypii TaxID=2805490 RepID=A0ABS1WX48_9GAMM|nr:PepSY domain-containing protein [Steroidobacter gossypii]MBM0105538.1 PepSY domain-containing protein [Steroidobacter gossypii]
MRTSWHLALVLLLPLIAAVPSANAQELIDRRQRREYRIEPSGMSLDQAVEMVQRRYRAKAVRAETVRNGDKRVHRIRLLSADGKVWNVSVDAESGAMN